MLWVPNHVHYDDIGGVKLVDDVLRRHWGVARSVYSRQDAPERLASNRTDEKYRLELDYDIYELLELSCSGNVSLACHGASHLLRLTRCVILVCLARVASDLG